MTDFRRRGYQSCKILVLYVIRLQKANLTFFFLYRLSLVLFGGAIKKDIYGQIESYIRSAVITENEAREKERFG